MGICHNCGKSIRLTKKTVICPNCDENPYKCWSCHHIIEINSKLCKLCHYFECENCGVCGPDCRINDVEYLVRDLIRQQKEKGKTIGTYKKIIRIIANELTKAPRLNCPFGVPISYAHGSLRQMYNLILENKSFADRFNTIMTKNIGEQWTVPRIKENGFHGIEMREASNLAVCFGIAKRITEKINGDNSSKIRYIKYERIDGKVCPYCDKESKEKEVTLCQLPRTQFIHEVIK